jgi:hypothetical protein
MAGCAAYQFFKGSFIKSFVTFMAALSASIVAYAWFEQIADILIQRETLTGWAQPLCLVVLFIVTFAVLQTIATILTRQPIDLGVNAERAGRIVFGLILGLVISGILLTAAATAPLSSNYPYQRFDPARPDQQKPHTALLNPDGFLARFFAVVSKGSLRGSQSFAVLHASFINELFLNRLLIDKKVPVFNDPRSIMLPAKAAVWPAPEELTDHKGAPLASKTGFNLIMARVGITAAILKSGGTFTLGQLRLICKQKNNKQPLQGSATDVYPVGYIKSGGLLQLKGLADQIKLQASDIKDKAAWIDFAFYVPTDFEPVAVGFMANIIAEVPPMVPAEQAPQPIPFIQSAACAFFFAKVAPAKSAQIYGLELASGEKLLQGITLNVSDRNAWTALQTESSIMPAKFDQEQITCVQAELKATEPNQSAQKPKENRIYQMLKPARGCFLVSLKCNTPAVGSILRGEQLPTLIDSNGATHNPCGIVAGGKVDSNTVFEFDYCSTSDNITLASDGSVAKPFPETIWLTEKAQSITEFYVLYMIKPYTVILSVRPAGAQTDALLEETEGFLVR